MSERCEKTRQRLVAFAQNELVGLEGEQVRAHLAHCAACAAVAADLAGGLAAARRVPAVDDAQMAKLAARAAAIAPPNSGLRILLVPIFAVVFASVILAAIGPQARSARRQEAASSDALLRSSPAPGLRMLTDASFVGAVSRSAEATTVTLRDGFVVLAAREPVAVETSGAVISAAPAAAGVRFSIDARGGRTLLVVATGLVTVTDAAGARTVAAGARVMLEGADADGVAAPHEHVAALLEDAQLVAFLAPPT